MKSLTLVLMLVCALAAGGLEAAPPNPGDCDSWVALTSSRTFTQWFDLLDCPQYCPPAASLALCGDSSSVFFNPPYLACENEAADHARAAGASAWETYCMGHVHHANSTCCAGNPYASICEDVE
jgi:hypothetical protein